jgi:UDP-N-acetylglucosamine--N-acetylmuramyl-(pentapeptide) pyrophosphoryl-undecaprenol N-acetylglucosamine transferase
VCGWILGIPVILHEQTSCIGRANKYSLAFAKKIAISRESTKKYIKGDKWVLTGNPVMTQIREVEPKTSLPEKPTLFIMGGSRGSQTINENIKPIIGELSKSFNVIHQTGALDYDDFKKLETTGYRVHNRIDPMKLDNVYREADLMVTRAGANTVSEILITGRPAILIPIPWSYLNEQYENAKYLKSVGLGEIIEQDALTPEILLNKITELKNNWVKIQKRVDSPDRDAAGKLVSLLEDIS